MAHLPLIHDNIGGYQNMTTILFYMKKIPFCSIPVPAPPPPPHSFSYILLPLGMAIESEMIDRFCHSRCLNNYINLCYMIGSFASCANTSKKWNYKNFPLLSIKSSPVDRFQSLRCLNDRINLSHIMGSLPSGATNFLVAKIGTKHVATSCSVYRIWTNGWILMFKVSKWPYPSPWYDRIICK